MRTILKNIGGRFSTILLYATIVVELIACNGDEDGYFGIIDNELLQYVELLSKTGERFKAFQADSLCLHYGVNNGENLSEMRISYPKGIRIYMNDTLIKSELTTIDLSDFGKHHFIYVSSLRGGMIKKEIMVYDLPVLRITTPDGNPIISKDIRTENCKVEQIWGGQILDKGFADIKSRGGSTWLLDKKPYNIKFKEKNQMLSMKKSKHWILLANAFFDRTQLHNDVAFEMARMTDFPWVQKGDFVEVILNGDYRGLYYLVEKIGVENGKIDIMKISETDIDGESLTGGYLLEMCERPQEFQYSFTTNYFNKTGSDNNYNLSWNIKKPEENIPEEQYSYIVDAMNYMESLIWDDDSLMTGKYRRYYDIQTSIDWWLVEEACLNEEASRSKNIFIYKERGDDKFYMGPPWDFDAWSFGLIAGTGRFFCKDMALYYRQLFKDPYFCNEVKRKWLGIYPLWIKKIPDFIERRYLQIKNAAKRNETFLWTEWADFYNNKTYRECIDDMKNNVIKQLNWMNKEINDLDATLVGYKKTKNQKLKEHDITKTLN